MYPLIMIGIKEQRNTVRVLFFWLMALVGLCLMFSSPALAAVGVNPPVGNPNDYAGGDWVGTVDDDVFTNDGTVTGSVFMSIGNDLFTNNGQIDQGMELSDGDDELINSGNIAGTVLGGDGNDTVTNTGTMAGNIKTEGDDDIVNNSGTVLNIQSGGQSDQVTNDGTVTEKITTSNGNDNVTNNGTSGDIETGANVDTIINNGTASKLDAGRDPDVITNNGTVTGNIIGDHGNDIITNNSTVNGTIYGSGNNDTIIVDGRVDGDVDAGNNNDTVTLRSGASVGGTVDGGSGTDGLEFEDVADAGAFTLANFESVTFNNTNGMSSDQPDATAATVNGELQMQGATYGAATVSVDGGTLSGNGQLSGDVTLSAGASIEPGSSIGTLSVGSLTMAAGTNCNAEVSGSTGDQIDSAGAVSLGGATLDVSGTPKKNATFIIINNGGGAVTGTFNGLAEGASFTSGGYQYQITYTGGDGNDVVLTALTGTEPPTTDPDPEPTPDPRPSPDIPSDGSGSPSPTGSLNGPTISWPKVGGSHHYNVYRAACPTCPKEQVGRVAGTRFTDETALPDQVYYYFVRSDNGALSDYSNWIPAWRYEQNPGREGDFNGDGVMDLLWWDPDSNQLSVWLMKDGAVQSTIAVGDGLDISQWLLVNTDDFNGDSICDLLWWNPATGETAVWYMAAQSASSGGIHLSTAALDDITGNVTLSYAGDLDGDLSADLVLRDYASGDISMWLISDSGGLVLNGPPTLAQGISDDGLPGLTGSLEWNVCGLNDLNGDGKADLVWQHASDGRVVVWLMDGAQAIGANEYQRTDSDNWRVAGLGDLNGDGLGDLVWRNDATGEVEVWLMTGGDLGYEVRNIAMGDDAINWHVKAVGGFCAAGADDIYCLHTDGYSARIVTLDGQEHYPN